MTLLTEKPEVSKLDLMTADPDALREYAVELAGRPVPGVRMSAEAFEAWAIDHADAEWVDGRIILMAPANLEHDDLQAWLIAIFHLWVEARDVGKMQHDAIVRLPGRLPRRVPDLLFVSTANGGRLKPTYIDGPPDLVIEIVSPDSQDRDRREKFQEYQAGGVPEYWIVDPISKRLDAFRMKEGAYELHPPVADHVEATALPGFYVRPSWLFGETLPKVRDCLAEIEAAVQKPAQPQPPASA